MGNIPGPNYKVPQHAVPAIGLSEILKAKDWDSDRELVLTMLDYGINFLTNSLAADEEEDRQINERGTEGRDATYELGYSALRRQDKVMIDSKDDRPASQGMLRAYRDKLQKLRDYISSHRAVTIPDEHFDELAEFFEAVSDIDARDAAQFATGTGSAVAK